MESVQRMIGVGACRWTAPRRTEKESLDETSRQALEWFQASVPERTLHNRIHMEREYTFEHISHSQ